MLYVSAGAPFSFEYPAFDQDGSLYVGGKVYEILAGVPTLVSSVAMALLSNGSYAGEFTGGAGKRYLVISAVFTDVGLTTVDTTRAPAAECFSCEAAGSTHLDFNYAAYDQSSDLLVGGNVYDTTGTASFVRQVAMDHVAYGVYFGTTTGLDGKAYSVSKLVYSDVGLTTPDLNWAPGADTFQCFVVAGEQDAIDAALKLAAPSMTGRISHQRQMTGWIPNQTQISGKSPENRELTGRQPNQRALMARGFDGEIGDSR